MENSSKIDLLLSKLRQPLHLNYISKIILNVDEFETKEILNSLIDEEVIVEKEKDFYVLKTN